jgi:hypothetical protein
MNRRKQITGIAHGLPAWRVDNGEIEMTVTQLGAQMAPVVFDQHRAPFQPYYISPWQEENLPAISPPVLVPLRGDFFCMPFGGNATPFCGEQHPPHGETCGSPWTHEGIHQQGDTTTLSLSLETKVRAGRIDRHLSLARGQPAIYSQTVIRGFAGPTTFAHHVILALPEQERSVFVSTSPFRAGLVHPDLIGNAACGEYQALLPGGRFTKLSEVPSRFVDVPVADCSAFPARKGYCDIVETVEDAGSVPSWVAVVNTVEHWLWFAFKDARLMPGRVFWMENCGRHGRPWNGRNRCLGIEDGCMYFDKGLAESAGPNPIRDLGVVTTTELCGAPMEIRYVQGAVRVPEEFGRVVGVEFQPGRAVFTAMSGQQAHARVDWEFALNLDNNGAGA